LLAPQLQQRGAPAAAAAGMLVTAALVPFVPPGVPIFAAALGVVVGVRR
jgi:hypothetical protein